jgi:predicted TIM-barrel fold metal-dependent hydrolase
MSLEEYDPKSTLVVPEHPVLKAKFPFIDAHHHPRLRSPEEVEQLIRDMDNINMRVMVNLTAGQGDRFQAQHQLYRTGKYKDRFVLFCNWGGQTYRAIDEPGFAERITQQLESDVKGGAQGLKILKDFGMDAKDSKGQRIHVDDPRFDQAFEAAGRLKIPVLIHTAEPPTHFMPIDKNNERWLELQQFPGRARPPERYPSFQTLLDEQHHLFAKHPKTIFINAHLGWLGGNLGELGRLMDKLPNMYTELGAVLAEIGRQPRTARAFFIKYQDRILMGKDAWEPRDPAEYQCYFRVLETPDEYFDYYRRRHANWKMYGLDLPDDVLKKVYYKNAIRIIPGISAKQFPL